LDKYGAVNVSPLSEGAGEIMPLYQISRNGVSREEALELLPDIREVAQQYPDDAFVQAALAEAEYDAGNNIMAIAAADRAIISDPQNISAHIQKMYALFKIASEEEGSEAEIKARWKTALKSVTAANRIENDHPLPLIYYYNSFQQRGRKPTPLAVRGLEQALGIAPYDDGLRVSVVGQMVNQKNYEKARAYLAPLQSDPHNNGRGKRAEKLLAAIDKLENGQSPRIALEKTKAAAN
jgi:tetratricopeptide (TPR) repeat protein